MNRIFTRAVAAALAVPLAAPVFAGALSEPTIEPAPELAPVPVITSPAVDWTGGYAGLQLGYGELSDGLDGNDVIGGVRAGYDVDFGNWVAGLGAEANFGTIETDDGDLDSLSTLRLRGGYDFGRTMVYAVTGASYAASEDLNDSWGYFGGLGLETLVTDSISVSGEVAAHRFDDYQDFGEVNATTATLGVNYRF